MKFKPEDFFHLSAYPKDCADLANAKLREWLDAAPVVLRLSNAMVVSESPHIEYVNELSITHRGRLVAIEEA